MEPITHKIFRAFKSRWFNLVNRHRFKAFGKNIAIQSPLRIEGEENIMIGDNVLVQYKSWLGAVPLTGASECLLSIGNGCTIGHFNEIFATQRIVIEANVLTADRVYISDNIHGYENPELPVMQQPVRQTASVTIGEGSWLGVGVAVIGASIGRHCVIGANAVVTKDIPDYSVAVGIPARVIKRYDFSSRKWVCV